MEQTTLRKPMSQASGISFQNIHFRYFKDSKVDVFHHFNLEIAKDKITVLTGPSGCGKSTLLYLAAGLYPENTGFLGEGQVLVDGEDVAKMSPIARSQKIRLVFQNADLQFCFPQVDKEIVFSMETANISPEDMPRLLDESLAAVGLTGFETREINSLSGGEKQRLSLACQLVSGAKWFLFDEIFAQVDGDQVDSIVKMLVALKDKYQLSYVVVDHHLENWLEVADDYILLNQDGSLRALPPETQHFTHEEWNQAGVILKANRYPPVPPAQAGESFLHIDQLSLSYGDKTILDKVDFTLQRGKIYALVGPSGIGKTSLLKAIAGFQPHQGSVHRLESDAAQSKLGSEASFLAKLTTRFGKKREVPYSYRFIFQNPQDQFLTNTVSEELLLSLDQSGISDPKEREERAIAILKANALWQVRRQAPFQLSEGQQRRLAVITLLQEQADLILCDEPSYAQDYQNTIAIMALLVEAARAHQAAIIFTSHDRDLVNHYADEVLQLEEGGRLCTI